MCFYLYPGSGQPSSLSPRHPDRHRASFANGPPLENGPGPWISWCSLCLLDCHLSDRQEIESSCCCWGISLSSEQTGNIIIKNENTCKMQMCWTWNKPKNHTLKWFGCGAPVWRVPKDCHNQKNVIPLLFACSQDVPEMESLAIGGGFPLSD